MTGHPDAADLTPIHEQLLSTMCKSLLYKYSFSFGVT